MAGSPYHPNNYFLHSDTPGLFSMLPWGTDQALVQRIPFDGPGGVLFDRCLADSVCLPLFRDAVLDTRNAVAGLNLDGLATSTAAMLLPWQQADPRREYSLEQIANAVSATRAFLAARPGDANAFLDPPPDDPPRPDNVEQPAIAVTGAVARSRARAKRCKRQGRRTVGKRCKRR